MMRAKVLAIACIASCLLSIGLAQAQSPVTTSAESTDKWGLTATDWRKEECGPLLTKARFGETYREIISSAKAGDIAAATLMLTFISCENDRFQFAGWSKNIIAANEQVLPRLGGEAFFMFPYRAECRNKEPIWCSPYKDDGPIGLLRNSIANEILRHFYDGPANPYLGRDIYDLIGLPQIEALAKTMLRSPNPRAWYATGERYSLGNDSQKDSTVRAAAYGIYPAINDVFSRVDQYQSYAPTFKQAYGNWQHPGYYDLALRELDKISMESGRAASLAAGFTKDNEAIKRYWRRAASLGWYPGGYSLIVAVQPSREGLAIDSAEALAWLTAAEQISGLPSAERARLTPFLERAAARRAARGSLEESANVAPNIATATATLLREMKSLNSQVNYYQAFSEFLGVGPQTLWDVDQGSVEVFSDQPGFAGYYQYQRFDIDNVRCTKAAAEPPTFNCNFQIGGSIELRVGGMSVGPVIAPLSPRSASFVWDGAKWTSPQLRADMLAGLKNMPTTPSAQRSPRDMLCRSLGAGVIAGGGKPASRATDPNHWGC